MATFTTLTGKRGYADGAGADTHIIGADALKVSISGNMNGDTINIEGLAADYRIKAKGRTVTLTDGTQTIVFKIANDGDVNVRFLDGGIDVGYNGKKASIDGQQLSSKLKYLSDKNLESLDATQSSAGVFEGTNDATAFTLTVGQDYADSISSIKNGGLIESNFKFTSANETVQAGALTLEGEDALIDGSSTDSDTLNATLASATTVNATIQGIENINLTSTNAGADIDFATVIGAKAVSVTGTASVELTNVDLTVGTTFAINDYSKSVTLKAATLAGTTAADTAESLSVTVSGATKDAALIIDSSSTGVENLESLTITSSGSAANTLTLSEGTNADNIDKITITGAADLTLKMKAAQLSSNTLIAADHAGKLTLDLDREAATTVVTSLAAASGYDAVVLRGTGDYNVTNLLNGTSVTIVESGAAGADALTVKGAASGATDSLSLTLDHKTADTNVTLNGAFAINDVETISIISNGGTTVGNQLGNTATNGGFEAKAATTINLSGDTKLTLNLDGDSKFTTLNISGDADHAVDFVTAVTYAAEKNVVVSAGSATGDLTLNLSDIVLDSGTTVIESLSVTTGAGKDVLTFGNMNAGSKLVVDSGAADDSVTVGVAGTGTSATVIDANITTGTGEDTIYLFNTASGVTTLGGNSQKIVITDFTAGLDGDVLNLTGWAGSGFATSFGTATAGVTTGLEKLGAFDEANITAMGTDKAFNLTGGTGGPEALAVLFNNNTGLTEVWMAYDIDGTATGTGIAIQKIATLENISLTGIADLTIDNFSFS